MPSRRRSRSARERAQVVAKYLLSCAVRDAGYKVVLTGEGSDEILEEVSPLQAGHAAL